MEAASEVVLAVLSLCVEEFAAVWKYLRHSMTLDSMASASCISLSVDICAWVMVIDSTANKRHKKFFMMLIKINDGVPLVFVLDHSGHGR